MARTPSQATPISHAVLEADAPGLPAIRDEIAQLDVLETQLDARVRAVATQIGYQLPGGYTDPDLIQRDISASMRRSVEACLEVGRGLTVLKAACEHGNFIARLEVLGIETRVAQKFMGTARKFANATSTPLLKAAGNQTKLFEMLVLDDEQIEELELTGQSGELKLDEIATMSVKELRAALRATRQDLEARGEVLEGKNRKIDELTESLAKAQRRVKALPPAEVADELRKEVTQMAGMAEVGILALRSGLAALAEHAETHGANHEDFTAGLICQLELAIKQLRGEFDIKTRPDGDDTPEWARPGAEARIKEATAAAMAENGWAFDAQGKMVPAELAKKGWELDTQGRMVAAGTVAEA
ncbi:hypothetical protein [Rhodocyclus gracilis]|uniref:hypothetical protein n=1 Tax=Rhodocyclus gracilis TaxID=2929842 RepID=UPI001E4A1303|nr:hypothetical protein [Rhodocyclus gracilis]